MDDIKALRLIRQDIDNLKGVSNPPKHSQDEKRWDDFEKKCTFAINHSVDTITQVAKYAKEMDRQLEELRLILNNSTKLVQERLNETLTSIGISTEINIISGESKKRPSAGKIYSSGKQFQPKIKKDSERNEPSTSKEGINLDAKKLEFALRLQKIEEMKQKIQESVLITQKIITDIDNGIGVTVEDVENLKGIINGWMIAQKDKNTEDQSKRTDNRQKSENEKKHRSEEDERRRRINEELKTKEEERRKLREQNERKLKEEEERRLQEETERRVREEKERNTKLEEERIQREKEEQLRKEEEDRKSKEEEEKKRLKEEEERRQREDEEKRRMQEEEDKKCMAMEKLKRDEEERLRKLEEERKRIEEEKLKRDPANWKPITYKRSEEDTKAFHGGVCCQVAAMEGTLDEDDLECQASDEWREEENSSVLNVDEKIASSIISIDAKTGEKTFPVPMRVYVPHCSIADSSDEIVVKMSIDGGEWTQQRPASVPPTQVAQLGLNYAGIDVSKFKTVKVVAVAKTRSQEFFVDKEGTNQISTVDKNIKLFIPRDTFSKACKLKLQVRQMRDHSLMFATQYYKHCHNVLSTGSVMKIVSEAQTDKNIELDLARNTRNEKRSREKGKYLHVYKCRGDSWKIADSEFKGKTMDVSVTLPSRKETYVVIEIEGRAAIPNDEYLKAADELYFHSNASIVRIIAKQKADNPHIMMIQCVGRDRVPSRMSELEILGYTHGPDTSNEFSLLDGQGITLECSGNIKIATCSEVNLIFHSYVDTAKQEVYLQVVDEYRQKELDVFLGNLHFKVMRDSRDVAFHNSHNGSIPLTLPKVAREQKRKARIQIRFPHYLTALAKFLAIRLTMQAKEDDWLQIIYSLDSRREMDTIRRRAVTNSETPDNDRQICEMILQDWMKYKRVHDDKIKQIIGVLRKCQKLPLADECERFVNFHRKHLSDSCMSEMAKMVEGDWESLASTLGLSKEEIDMCRQGEGDSNEEKAFNVLCKWRVSEMAIISGFDVLNDILGRLESAQSNMGLKNYIRHVLIQME